MIMNETMIIIFKFILSIKRNIMNSLILKLKQVAMNSLKSSFVLFLMVLCTLAESQSLTLPPPPPPSGKISTADSLKNAGDIKGAVEAYKKAYSLHRGDYNVAYDYACALSLDRQIDSSFKLLYIALSIEPSISVLTDPDLLPLHEDSRWKDFENNVISAVKIRTGVEFRDEEYAKTLCRLLCMDQYCFYETAIAVSKLGPGSPVVYALRRLQGMINEKNVRDLENLLSRKGWPKRSEVGQEASRAAFFVLQHSNAVAQEKYITMFEKACKENEASWQQYALMFDRMRMNQNLPQKYGTHNYLDPRAGNTNELYPLEDETKVDEWRKEIGLEPLKDYLTRTGIKYNPASAKN